MGVDDCHWEDGWERLKAWNKRRCTKHYKINIKNVNSRSPNNVEKVIKKSAKQRFFRFFNEKIKTKHLEFSKLAPYIAIKGELSKSWVK